jgi:bacillithiol system protein YtxJ
MGPKPLELGADPERALEAIRRASLERPVLVFKHSPICPVSLRARDELSGWLESGAAHAVTVVELDVLAERALARGLTAALGVRHESPQALWFADGELAWHGSHGALTAARFAELGAG